VELCGARLVPGTIDVAAEIPERHQVRLRTARAERLLGMRVEPADCETYLRRLAFDVSREGEDIDALVPVHRHYDVTREVDLIEEVGRIRGYADHVPATLPEERAGGGRLSHPQLLRRRTEDVMRDQGFDGIVTLSLTAPGLPGALRLPADDPRSQTIRISNPLSQEHSALRTTLMGSLLDAARYNLARGAERASLYEVGRVYLREGDPVADGPLGGAFAGAQSPPAFEPQRVACVATGALVEGGWRDAGVEADFYAVKAVLDALGAGLGLRLEVARAEEPFLHPGRTAHVLLGADEIGWVGELHPLVCRAWDLDSAAGFELNLAPLIVGSPYGREHYDDVISYPAVHQDIAVVVPEDAEAARVRAAVLAGGGDLLRFAEVFDLYRGEQLGEGRKSLALRLEFRAPDRTLTDAEVAKRREAIRAAVGELGGSLRE
jgi:phenylalanyl-tRNA synthetase beta chain